MPLPTIEGEVALKSNSDQVFRQLATGGAAAEKSLAGVEQAAKRTDAALDAIGSITAPTANNSALRTAEAERVRIHEQTAAQIEATEQEITANAVREAERRLGIERQTAAQRSALLQAAEAKLGGPAPAQTEMLRQLAEMQLRAKEASSALKQLNADASQAGRLDAFLGQRAGAIRNEGTLRQRLAGTVAAAVNQAEALITSRHKAESDRRKKANDDEARQRQQGQGLLGKVGGSLVEGAAFVGIGLGVREIGQQIVQIAELGTEVQRADEAFKVLSGSSAQAESRLRAVVAASGGTVDNLSAMTIANKAAVLGMANTAQELERVTRLATVVGRVMGTDIVSTLDNLQSAAANLSFVRLDTMGISASKVRDRFNELLAANQNLGKEQAFLQATVEVGERTFNQLGESALNSGSGLELLKTRVTNLKNELAELATKGALDGFFRGQAVGADSALSDQIKVIADTAQRIPNAPISGLFDSEIEKAKRLDLVVATYRELQSAQRAGAVGADEYAAAFGEIVDAVIKNKDVTDEQIGQLVEMADKFDIGTAAIQRFKAALNQENQTAGLDAIQAKLEDLQHKGIVQHLFDPTIDQQIEEVKDILALAQKNASRGIAITVDPRVEGIVGEEIAKTLPQAGVFDEIQQAEQNLIDKSLALAAAQKEAGGAVGGVVTANLQAAQAAKDRAANDLSLLLAQQQLEQANIAYGESLAGLGNKTQEQAQRDLDAAQKALDAASARKVLITTADELAAAEQQLADARKSGRVGDIQAAQIAVQVAQSRQQQAQATLNAATGEEQASSSVSSATTAWQEFDRAMRQIVGTSASAIASQSGIPPAFDATGLSADQLKTKLQQLAQAIAGIAGASRGVAAASARPLLPLLGIEGTLEKTKEFQQHRQVVIDDFIADNDRLKASGQDLMSEAELQQRLSFVDTWHDATVRDTLAVEEANKKSAKGSADAWENAQKRIDKATDAALDGLVRSVLQPQDATGLISGNDKFKDGQNKDLLEAILPKEADIQPNVGRIADVAVNGFKSQWFESMKGFFSDDILAGGERAVQEAAGKLLSDHQKGLSTILFDVPAATNAVLEKIQAKQNTDAFVETVKQQVQGVAALSDIDIKSALGIDTTAEQIGAAVTEGFTSALGNLPQNIETLLAKITGEDGAAIGGALTVTPEQQQGLNDSMLAAVVTAAGTAATDAPGEISTNPLVAAATPTEDQAAVLATTAKDTLALAGEAMVTQASDGNYGGRAIDAVIAAIEAKQEDIQKAGRNAADWLGKALSDRFRDSVPAQLLNTLVTELVPLMAAASANSAERTAGAGTQ